MNTLTQNPSLAFYRHFENDIKKVRKSLFFELDSISVDFGSEARKILEDKIKSNQNKPLLGELFPWIIKDIINGENAITHRISVGWLSLYLYTIFLDEYIDNPKLISPTKFLAGSVLAKVGLLKISRFTNETSYEKYIDTALSFSAHNQNLDSQFQNETTKGNLKVEYSKGKNHVLLSCAGALAAENSNYGLFITQFSESLLLALQYLDDIADFKEDFKSGNMTVLLNEAFKNNPKSRVNFKNNTNRKLLEEIIITGALYRVMNKVMTLLSNTIVLIQKNKLDDHNNKPSIELFIALNNYVSEFNYFLKNKTENFINHSLEEQKNILDKTEKYITIIAQSS